MPAVSEQTRLLLDATSGSLGAVLVAVLLYPIDIAKTKIQSGFSSSSSVSGTLQDILASEGVLGLFRGVVIKSFHAGFQNFIYFYVYEWLKATAKRLGMAKQSTMTNAMLGTLAGVANLSITLPIETLTVRLQTAPMGTTLGELARESWRQGLLVAYRGFSTSAILTLNPALTFSIFDALKARILKALSIASGRKIASLSVAQAFFIASFSKTLATMLTYPLMRAKVVMQAAPVTTAVECSSESAHANGDGAQSPTRLQSSRLTMVEVIHEIWRREGLSGLYRGCDAQIFTAVTKSGILLTAKEKLFEYALLLATLFSKARRLADRS